VIVPQGSFDFWLDSGKVDAMTAAVLFDPGPDGLLDAYEVSSAVNSAANDGPQLIDPAPAEAAEPTARAPAARAKKKDERQGSLF
jgi:putative SOS response-associated peptidase YedK